MENNLDLNISAIPWEEKIDEIFNNNIVAEDLEKNWSDYLENTKEKGIIKSTTLEKYKNKLKEKELVYKECVNCDSGMVLISDVLEILNEIEKEYK